MFGSSSRLSGEKLSIRTLLRKFPGYVGVTWLLTLSETVLIALVPLFVGFAIDGMLASNSSSLINLAGLLGLLVFVGVVRRLFDTRAYGTIRVELGKALVARSRAEPVSKVNARLDMGRELADFLEEQVPLLLSSIVQLCIVLIILWSFHLSLFASSLVTGVVVLLIYVTVHKRFFRLNGKLNFQMEQQVGVLSGQSPRKLNLHMLKLRRAEVGISDTEAWVYGAMFLVLVTFIIFNLWFATSRIDLTVGSIFSIISYSWEFVEAVIVLPATLQNWSRLSEITQRINA